MDPEDHDQHERDDGARTGNPTIVAGAVDQGPSTPLRSRGAESATPTTDPIGGPSPGEEPANVRVDRPRRRRWPRRLAWTIGVPLALLALLVGAWGLDTAIAGDSVPRNTQLAGVPVGGMGDTELAAVVDDLGSELPDTTVEIDTSDLRLESTAGDLGIGLERDATIDTVMMGSTEPLWQRPFEWLGSFFTPRAAPVELTIDDASMAATIEALEGEQRKAPVEPSLVVTDGVVSLSPGVNGVRLDASRVIEALPQSLSDVGEPIRVDVERTVVPPRFSDAELTPLVEGANAMAARTTTVHAGEQTFEIKGSTIIEGVSADLSGEAPHLVLSDKVVGAQILSETTAYDNPTDVRFVLGGGGLVPTAGHDAQVCCGDGATAAITEALLAGRAEVEVPTRTMTAAQGVQWASTLGVGQRVSEFTTPHRCCQTRVNNIHTIADRVRGTLIPPGATFSVNGLTGRRTTEKGYLAAPAIIDGKHVPDVGGGVSQFATTLFNAAFFAGLPIPDYKMHSEYISRYPYAREATLFYPTVDLKIRNDTPYGIVIWPTYTDTSLTVQLWSTPWAHGAETGKTQSSGCGQVTTYRTITYPDGTTAQDSFNANYRCG